MQNLIYSVNYSVWVSNPTFLKIRIAECFHILILNLFIDTTINNGNWNYDVNPMSNICTFYKSFNCRTEKIAN